MNIGYFLKINVVSQEKLKLFGVKKVGAFSDLHAEIMKKSFSLLDKFFFLISLKL
jgi:hypothetical protein